MGALSVYQMDAKDKSKIHEVYVWMNGHLLYKKWMKTGESMVFNNGEIPYTRDTLLSITQDENGNIVKTYNEK